MTTMVNVKRAIVIEYSIPIEHYPNMSRDEICEHEKSESDNLDMYLEDITVELVDVSFEEVQ